VLKASDSRGRSTCVPGKRRVTNYFCSTYSVFKVEFTFVSEYFSLANLVIVMVGYLEPKIAWKMHHAVTELNRSM
jgi:hypothetical protein